MAGEGMRFFLEIDNVLTEVLTTELAAYHYNYAQTTIRKWSDEGKITSYKIAGGLFIKKSSLEDFLKLDIATQNVAE
jgi:hypothetical protein